MGENECQDPEKGQFDPLNKKKKVGNYLLGKLIGEGAFSKVRQALHIIAREKVAVKIVPKKAALLREYVKKAVRREAMLLQKLEHPNITRLYEIMETENSYYLVLEYAERGDFIKYLSEKQMLSETETQKYMRQIASAVDHMHTSNIAHRDLKLENLLLDKDNNIKIIDFGASNVYYGDYSLSTQCGSPVYAAPEMYCNRKYGPPVDVWSMGICMYAMLTGKLPFLPDPPNNYTMLHSLILRGAQLPESLSEDCANMLSRMLAVDQGFRITVEEVLIHPWLQENHQTPLLTRQPPIGKLYPHVPKTAIVTYMTNVFNFIEDDVFYSVIERKMNAVAATYYLLLKKFLAGVQLGMSLGYQASPSSALKVQDPKRAVESGKHSNLRTELPAIQTEQSLLSESINSASKSGKQLKSYIQLLKDSKAKSAQSLGLRSGYSFSSKQKDFTIRRHKTRSDLAKHTRSREDVCFLPDFILTYTQNESAYNNPANTTTDKFEWEQTFLVSKKEPAKFQTSSSFRHKKHAHAQNKYSEPARNVEVDGRNESVDVTLQAPPTSPATPFPPQISSKSLMSPTEQMKNDKKYADIPKLNFDGGYKTSMAENTSPSETWNTIPRQKIQLTRGTSVLDKTNKSNIAVHQFGRPPNKPKTLTPSEARSYFREIEHAQVVGQGRKLVEREKVSSSKIEELHSLWSRKARTAGSHRQFPDFTHSASTFGRPSTHEIHFRSVDPNGILQFPDIIRQPLYDERLTSPKETVVDGVTDVIKVQITSSAKY